MTDPHDNTCPLPPDALRLRVAALTALQTRVKSELDSARDELSGQLSNGESHTVWSPLAPDEQIASVNRSKPKPSARVADRAALDAWMAQHYPDECRTTRTPTAEGVELLADMAPDLLDQATTATDQAVNAVLKASEKARQPVHPDGTLDPPGVRVATGTAGRLSVRLDGEAERLVSDLISAGRIDTHGNPHQIQQ